MERRVIRILSSPFMGDRNISLLTELTEFLLLRASIDIAPLRGEAEFKL
jgi:hypothetical protein